MSMQVLKMGVFLSFTVQNHKLLVFCYMTTLNWLVIIFTHTHARARIRVHARNIYMLW
jgi:hypothetical protein